MRIETERLILRAWQPGDLEPYAHMCAKPEVMRWISTGTPQTEAQSRQSVENFITELAKNGFGLLAVEIKADGQFIGFCGLSVPDFLPEIMPAVEIGWRLDPAAWGKGYATEAARAVMAHGFGALKLDRIVSIYQIGNDASENIMKKLGMDFDREAVTAASQSYVRVYAITRDAYRAKSTC